MAKRNVEKEILEALDLFVSQDKRFPVTNDGKVNVSGLCKELGLKPSDVQHFHKKDSVKLAVNAIAGEQDILPIGARAISVAEDKAVRERIAKVTSRSKDLGQAAAEQSAAIGAMSETVRHLKEQLVILADENTRLCRDNSALKERLKILRNGGVEPPFI